MKSRLLAVPLIVVSLLLPSSPARACSLCACGDPMLAASDPAAMNGTLRLQLDTEYQRIRAGTEGVPGSTDELTQWSYRLNAVFKPADSLALSVTLPIVTKSMHTLDGGMDMPTSKLTRFGDVELAARYGALRWASLGTGRVQELAVTAGASLPTGDYQATVDGALVDPHGQVGSGSYGPFVGLSYLLEQGSWLAFASASWRHRTETTYFDTSSYRFGAALLWSVHAQYRPARAIAIDLGVDGRYARADRATDVSGNVVSPVENTGGTVLSAAPGIYVNARGGAWLFVRAQIPFVKSLRGEQDVLPSFTTGVQLQAL
jgi:hypothetical protein